jgi:hypothetical protein
MKIRNNRTWALCTVILLLSAAFSTVPFGAGCAVENLPNPALFDACRDSEDPCVNQAYAGERASVVLIGENFNPAFAVDINNDDPPPLRGAFRAFIADMPFEDVRRHSEFRMLGTLPGTVPLGSHDVTMEFPGGMHTRLEDAFSIVDPLSVTVTPEHQRIPQGQSSGLDVTLQNLGPVLLTQITLSLSQEGTGRFVLPADSVLSSLGGESTSTTTLQLQAQQPGSATLKLDVSALAGGNVLVGTAEPLVVEFLVLPPAALVASAEVSPTTVDPGEGFELIVDVFNTGGTDALDVEVLEPVVSGSGSATLADPAPARLDIAAGSRQAIRFSGQALQSGTVVFDVRVQGLEAISQRLLGPVDADPVSIEIR